MSFLCPVCGLDHYPSCEKQEKIGCVQHDCEECQKREAQEPVAWTLWWEDDPNYFDDGYISIYRENVESKLDGVIESPKIIPLYTHPAPSWQGLSISEEDDFIKQCYMVKTESEAHQLVLDIEAKLKEKNG